MKKIKRSRCEALLSCGNGREFYGSRVERIRCTSAATEMRGEHALCWVHARAHDNPTRIRPLAYAGTLDGRCPAELAAK